MLPLANAPNTTALRTYAGDLSILCEIFWQHTYDLPQLRVGAFRTVVDVGANVGLAVLLFLEKFPVIRLVYVEPESANFRLLQRNLRSTPAVALHATNGVVKIDSSSQAYNTKIIAHTGTTKVVAMSMPSLLHSQGLA